MIVSNQKSSRNKTWELRHIGRLRGQFSRKDLVITPSALGRFLDARRNASLVGKRVRTRISPGRLTRNLTRVAGVTPAST